MALLRMASAEYDYDIDPGEVAKIWRAGCIIRAALLGDIRDAFQRDPGLVNLLLDDAFRRALVAEPAGGWRDVVQTAVGLGIPCRRSSASLAYYDAYRSARLPGEPHAGAARLLRRAHLPAHRPRRRLSHRLDPRQLTSTHDQGVADSDPTARSTSSRSARSSIGSTRASCRFARRRRCAIHVSGGEFNTAANLVRLLRPAHRPSRPRWSTTRSATSSPSACARWACSRSTSASSTTARAARTWRPSTAIAATACAARWSSTTAPTKPPRSSSPATSTGTTIFGDGVRWFHSGGIFAALSETTAELIIEAMQAAKAHGAVVSFDLNYREKLWTRVGRPRRARRPCSARIVELRRRARRQRRGPAEGPRHPRARGRREVEARLRAPSSG